MTLDERRDALAKRVECLHDEVMALKPPVDQAEADQLRKIAERYLALTDEYKKFMEFYHDEKRKLN